jgi:hypothetical protein
LPAHVQVTVSPTVIVTALGVNLVPPCPTVTLVVAAETTTGTRDRKMSEKRKSIVVVLLRESM